MSDWGQELPKFKAARRGEVEPRATTGGRRTPRKWRVVSDMAGGEFVVHRSASKEGCEAWIEKQSKTYYVGRRNAPQAMHDQGKEKAKKRADAYRIAPPPSFRVGGWQCTFSLKH